MNKLKTEKEKISEKNFSKTPKNDFTLKILTTYKETIVDGVGLRYSLYFAGCSHACPGCHNEYSWNPNHGNTLTYEILEKIEDYIVYPGLGDEAGFVGSIALGKIALENNRK